MSRMHRFDIRNQSGWEGILGPDETIQWQGRPNGKIVIGLAQVFSTLFGLLFSGFALFWMIMASRAGGFFWMFGMIHFTAGLGIIIGPTWYTSWRRRHTWYTLTTHRAFVATDLPFRGRDLTAWTITPNSVLSISHGKFSSVYFDKKTRRTDDGNQEVKIGFERIEDGEAVYAMMRDMQRRDESKPQDQDGGAP